jgi:hypothetical protein
MSHQLCPNLACIEYHCIATRTIYVTIKENQALFMSLQYLNLFIENNNRDMREWTHDWSIYL